MPVQVRDICAKCHKTTIMDKRIYPLIYCSKCADKVFWIKFVDNVDEELRSGTTN